MFTGIITATTQVVSSRQTDSGLEMTFKTPSGWQDLKTGESIATNGVCLTIARIEKGTYTVFLIPETLSKTTFGQQIPAEVNLERALTASGRLDGHFVQGHIDTAAVVTNIDTKKVYKLEVTYPKKFTGLVIAKGSVAVDGVALTVANSEHNKFSVALIPHTLMHTTLHRLVVNSAVNVEFDMLGKYVINFMENKRYATGSAG